MLHCLPSVGLHLLAVASPWRQELHEDGLAADCSIPILLGELFGIGQGQKEQRYLHVGQQEISKGNRLGPKSPSDGRDA